MKRSATLLALLLVPALFLPAAHAAGFLDSIGEKLDGISQNVSDCAESAWNDISDYTEETWNNVSDYAGEAWDSVSGYAEGAWNDISAYTESLWHSSAAEIRSAWDDMSGAVREDWAVVGGYAADIWDEIVVFGQTSLYIGKSSLEDALDLITPYVDSLWQNRGAIISNALDDGGIVHEFVIGSVSEALIGSGNEDVNEFVIGTVSTALRSIADAVRNNS